jgi:hypothetical protein
MFRRAQDRVAPCMISATLWALSFYDPHKFTIKRYPRRSHAVPTEHVQGVRPTLCRLYFGKEFGIFGSRPNRFFNSANFPLDVSRYRELLKVTLADDCVYPSVEDITFGMGEMLGRLHWRAGYDGGICYGQGIFQWRGYVHY